MISLVQQSEKYYIKYIFKIPLKIISLSFTFLFQDMLANEAINIDWMFSCSIITDISEVSVSSLINVLAHILERNSRNMKYKSFKNCK